MVRVKLTGEVTEVDREVMKSLRAEEKKLRRSYGTVGTSDDENGEEKSSDTVLSLDALPEDDVKSSAWLADPANNIEMALTEMCIEDFRKSLSSIQLEIFDVVMLGGVSRPRNGAAARRIAGAKVGGRGLRAQRSQGAASHFTAKWQSSGSAAENEKRLPHIATVGRRNRRTESTEVQGWRYRKKNRPTAQQVRAKI